MTSRLVVVFLVLAITDSPHAEEQIERDVVYGVLSGLALLMDVYHPSEPNGSAVIFVAGSG